MGTIKLNGLTNKIVVDNNIVIKTSNEVVDFFIDRKHEQGFYEQTKDLDQDFMILPFAWEFKKNGRFESKLQYYPTATTFEDTKRFTAAIYNQVINLIESLHKLDLEMKVFEPARFLEKFKKACGPIFELEQYKEKVIKIMDNYWDDKVTPVVSHNDLVAGNFLKVDKKLKLIDFEFVYKNHPLFDYASFASETLSYKEAQAFILKAGFKKKQREKLVELVIFQNYLWAYWAKYMYMKTNKKIYHTIMLDKISKIKEWYK